MDPTYYSTKMREHSSSKSLSLLSTNTTDTRQRKRISDAGLNPVNGALKCRLNHGNHFPTAPNQDKCKTHCQLHLWATGKQKYTNVQHCRQCNVTLYTDNCYKRFHTVQDLAERKEEIEQESEDKIASHQK